MAFLHGIEHLNLPADFTPVNDVVTAVIGLVGTADSGATNELILCKSAKDDAQFGTQGTIPEALAAIRLQEGNRGSALVFVIKIEDAAGTVTPDKIVGAVSAAGERTGLKLFETAISRFGFEPMIYIVPRYSALGAVKTELIAITNKTEAMAYIDTPDGMTFDEALQSRNNGGTFASLSDGIKLLFPHFLTANPAYVDETTTPGIPKYLNKPMSAFAAGLRAKMDMEFGWHTSSSNNKVVGVESTDLPLTFALGDTACEANLLNAAGIVTAVNMMGTGIVEWGNYSAGYPGNANTDAFECVRRTRAIMKRAIEKACTPYIDKPFIKANVDAIRNTVNQYLNTLVSQGKIVQGVCSYVPESNPTNELAQGHLTFDIVFTPALPIQRLSFTYKIDLAALGSIG
jgi:phage tail sheath protein FI